MQTLIGTFNVIRCVLQLARNRRKRKKGEQCQSPDGRRVG